VLLLALQDEVRLHLENTQNIFWYFADGQTKQFTAAEDAVKVKLYIDELDKWVQQVFYLKEGGHLDIVINGKTIVGNKEP